MKKITPKIIVNGKKLSPQTLIANRQNLELHKSFVNGNLMAWSKGQNDINLSTDVLNSYLGGNKKSMSVYYSFLQQAAGTAFEFQDRDKMDFEVLQTSIANSSGIDLENLYNLLTSFLQYQVFLNTDINAYIISSSNSDEIMIISRIILELTDSPLNELKDYLEESIKKMSYPKISRLKIKSVIFDISRQTINLEKDEVIIKISQDSPINIIGTEEEIKGNKRFRDLSDFLFELDKPSNFNILSDKKIEISIAEVPNIREYVYRRDNRLHHH